MKLIKIRIKRENINNTTHYTYPTPYYDAKKVKFGPIYEGGLDSVVESDILPRNANDEYIIVGVDDADLSQFLQSNNYEKNGFIFTAIEVDKEGALTDGNKWTGPQVERITDQNKVIDILAKVAREEELTQDDKDAIDPENPVLGINRTPSLEDKLDEFLGS